MPQIPHTAPNRGGPVNWRSFSKFVPFFRQGDRGNRSIGADGDDDSKDGVVHFGRTEAVPLSRQLPHLANRMSRICRGF